MSVNLILTQFLNHALGPWVMAVIILGKFFDDTSQMTSSLRRAVNTVTVAHQSTSQEFISSIIVSMAAATCN